MDGDDDDGSSVVRWQVKVAAFAGRKREVEGFGFGGEGGQEQHDPTEGS